MRVIAALLALTLPTTALAACPVELSVYGDRDGVAEINFHPPLINPSVSNAFKMIVGQDIILDGMVMWTEGVERPVGMLHLNCPDGDVTGDELAACTVWQGVIYAVEEGGATGLLPRQGKSAPQRLIFADLASSIATAPALEGKRPTKLPFDVFQLKGCQE